MKPVMYVFLNRGLRMTIGKAGAQIGHAVSRAQEASRPDLVAEWKRSKHETTLIMLATSTEDLLLKERYLNDRGFETELIIDEGRTEVPPHSATAFGVPIVDKDEPEVLAAFSDFKVYREEEPERSVIIASSMEDYSKPWWRR